jgi:hypothetical protein
MFFFDNNFEKSPLHQGQQSSYLESDMSQNFKMQKHRERGGIHAEVPEEFRKGSYKGTMPWVSYIERTKPQTKKDDPLYKSSF